VEKFVLLIQAAVMILCVDANRKRDIGPIQLNG
jgi:hypothetical protein